MRTDFIVSVIALSLFSPGGFWLTGRAGSGSPLARSGDTWSQMTLRDFAFVCKNIL
jgi:lipid-binding SYLF domain-containing protein